MFYNLNETWLVKKVYFLIRLANIFEHVLNFELKFRKENLIYLNNYKFPGRPLLIRKFPELVGVT